MDYKLVALDLDGTLLTDDKKISKENIDVLKRINDLGVEIVIATGRRYWSAKQLTTELGFDFVVMANNGNIARKISDEKLLLTKYLDTRDFYTLIKEGRKRGLYPIIHVDHYADGYDIIIEYEIHSSKYGSYMSKNLDRYKKMDNSLNYKEGKVLAVCYVGDLTDLKEFEKFIKTTYPKRYSSHIMSKLVISGGLLEIMNPLGSKWISLKEYASGKDIKTEEIIAIGDDNNDIDMIKNSGLGIAMKNGSQKAKETADLVTKKSNNEAGVGHVLQELLLI